MKYWTLHQSEDQVQKINNWKSILENWIKSEGLTLLHFNWLIGFMKEIASTYLIFSSSFFEKNTFLLRVIIGSSYLRSISFPWLCLSSNLDHATLTAYGRWWGFNWISTIKENWTFIGFIPHIFPYWLETLILSLFPDIPPIEKTRNLPDWDKLKIPKIEWINT